MRFYAFYDLVYAVSLSLCTTTITMHCIIVLILDLQLAIHIVAARLRALDPTLLFEERAAVFARRHLQRVAEVCAICV